jgi:hypothetical protein
MTRFVLFLAAGLLSVGMVGPVWATPITITDTTLFDGFGTSPAGDYDGHGYGAVDKLDGFLDYVQWTHHFPDDPPPIQTALSGVLTVYLVDNENDNCLLKQEFAFGWTEDGTWDFGEVDTGAYSYSVNASYLNDGEYQVTLGSVFGDFYITQSDLQVTYEPRGEQPVPEASTLMLFGSGLSGLAFWVRKRGVLRA